MTPSTLPPSLLDTALAAVEMGFSVHFPREDGTKAPDWIYPDGVDEKGKTKWTWLHPDGQPASKATLREWYGRKQGIGLRCGTASGGLECYEFDCRDTYEAFRETAARCGLGYLVARIEAGYLEETPGGGVHWLYLTDEIRGNTKLAKEPVPTDEDPQKVKTLIETKGENGFIIIAPSGGKVHKTGRSYILTGGGLATITTITAEERNDLWDLGRFFDAMPRGVAEPEPRPRERATGDGIRPGDVYEQEVSWDEVLTPHQWTPVYRRGETTAWRRPGKTIGLSATTNYAGSGQLYVFSTSTSFASSKSYSKFAAYAVLHHCSNFSEAARALRKAGFGESQEGSTSHHLGRSAKASDGTCGATHNVQGDNGLNEAEWSPPRLSEVPYAEPFPVDVLPPLVAMCIRSIAASIGCPVDYPALSMLIAAGAAIGRSASLLLKPGYFASASLYGMNVGDATSGKTPSLNCALAPLVEINFEWSEHHETKITEFETEEDAYNRSPKNKTLSKPVRPKLKTVLLNDCTAEIVKSRLAENPRGLLIAYDEGSAWIGSLNQYKSGKGTDRQFFLSVLNGSSIRVDRMKDKDHPTSIRHPFLSVIGNMTPETLSDLREGQGRSDGFVERILFAYPDPMPRPFWCADGFDPEMENDWRKIVKRLMDRPLVHLDGRDVPHVVLFSPEAKRVWIDWFNTNVIESRTPGYESSEISVDGKLENFTARLALILHLLTLASDPTTDPTGAIPPLSAGSINGAIALWRYFRAHHRRVRWQMNGGVENKDARNILDWIRRRDRSSFSRKELTDHLRWLGDRPGGPDGVLGWMEDRHILRKRPKPLKAPGKRGQDPSPEYEVNPDFVSSQNSRNSGSEPAGDPLGGNSANSANEEDGKWTF